MSINYKVEYDENLSNAIRSCRSALGAESRYVRGDAKNRKNIRMRLAYRFTRWAESLISKETAKTAVESVEVDGVEHDVKWVGRDPWEISEELSATE